MMSFLKFVTLVATLTTGVLSNGATEKPQHFRCYLDWCLPPLQYCNSDEERCAPCFDVCQRSSDIPKNCTQTCQEPRSPKTTTQAPGSLAESKSYDDRLEAMSQQMQTQLILIIIVLIVVVAILVAIGPTLYKRRKACRGDDTEQPEEKRPLQATESYQSSESQDSQPFLASDQYPGETALDKGEPPIFRSIAVGPNQPSMPSRPNEQAQTYLASSSLFSGPPQSPSRGAGAMSMPGGPAGQGLTGSAFPVSMPLTQQDANRIQDHKGFNVDFDVSGNMNPVGYNGRDVSNDSDNTAPKSNDFGTRPMDV